MKKIFFLFIAYFVSSCAAQRYSELYFTEDFRAYSDEGFVISPLVSHAAPYRPIATISIEFTPGETAGERDVEVAEKSRQGDLYHPPQKPSGWHHPSYTDMLDKLVNHAKSLGANGILCYRFEEFESGSEVRYRLSGFAVEL
jgi:hypothetical protein